MYGTRFLEVGYAKIALLFLNSRLFTMCHQGGKQSAHYTRLFCKTNHLFLYTVLGGKGGIRTEAAWYLGIV